MTQEFVTLPREVVEQAIEALWTAATPKAEAAIAALRSALDQPQANQPAMTPIAQRKLEDLMASGYTISGYSIYNEQKHQHGFVTGAGLVGWWKPEGMEYPQPQGNQEPAAWLYTDRLGGKQEFTSEPPPGMKALCQPLFYRARSAAAPQPPEHYDQQALDLCSTCGWKTLIPGDCCLNCAQHQPQGDQGAVGFVRQVDIEHLGNTPSDWASMFGQATGYNTVPVYTRPQPRQPLTDEAVLGVAKSIEIQFDSERLNEQIDDILAFARAIERAHNIK